MKRPYRLLSACLLPALIFGALAATAMLAGCQSAGTIQAGAVDATFRRVADRHDKYVNADPNLSDLEKRVDLRDTALLRGVLDEANKTVTPAPATQPK